MSLPRTARVCQWWVGRAFASHYKIPIYRTIAEALCQGREKLAVDAVLSIGEHGQYPKNEKGQHEYPRKRFFDEIVTVFRKSGAVAPVFTDKHLSYRWDWAKEMYDYEPRDYRRMREMGATWKIITEEMPEPKGIEMWRKP